MRDNLLIHLDVGPSGAILRTLLGLAFALALRAWAPGAGLAGASGALLVLLFGVKAFAVVARRLAGASARVKAEWERRRKLARYHDSYQWRKLTWFGVGILAAGLLGPRARWELALGAGCLASGLIAEGFWRRLGVPGPPKVAA